MHSNNPPGGGDGRHDLRSTLIRRQILDGARQVFLLNGFAGTTIDQIMAHAGVPKTALYRHFGTKDALFRALIAAEAERISKALPSMDQDDPDPRSALRQIGVAVLETMNNAMTFATLRLVIGALGRFPQMGEEFLRNSLGPTMRGVASYLDGGAPVPSKHAGAAAEEFTRRCMAHVMERVLVPGQPLLTDGECTAAVEDILRNCAGRRRDAARHGASAGGEARNGERR